MTSKKKKVPEFVYQDYKDLPPKIRASVNVTAIKLLEIQKKNKVFLNNATDPSLYEDGEKKD